MKYIFSYSNTQKHFIDIEFVAENIAADETTVQLPAWRPGRYELANFAKYIKQFLPADENGSPLPFHKITKDCWKIQTNGIKELHIKYNFFAAELNAGSSFSDESQLYVNPVNCCVYIANQSTMAQLPTEECVIELLIPDNYQVATALPSSPYTKKQKEKSFRRTFVAKNYDELVDSPFIASPSLQHNMFIIDGVEFNLWLQGEIVHDLNRGLWSKIINDFFIFINEHFVTMQGTIPVDEYHFLFQVLPYKFHHGVEHLASAVIALGPPYNVMRGDGFLEFLSISSHELFHSWNVKAFRPAEMVPYNYTKENYSRLNFVTEGVTTYYGDFLLFRSGIYSEFEVNRVLSKHLQNHFDNFGRYNLSVGDSSFDTWLDGYTPELLAVPHRKTSIYSDGCLIALITDLLIRKYTINAKSLDDVMRFLYKEYGNKGIGYNENNYKDIIEKMAGTSFDEFFSNYVYKANSYENALRECFDYVGLELLNSVSKKYHERFYGIKINESFSGTKVTAIFPNSIAEEAGIELGDEIISINGYALRNDLAEWSKYFGINNIQLIVRDNRKVKTISFKPTGEEYYKIYYVQKIATPTEAQKKNFEAWSKRRF